MGYYLYERAAWTRAHLTRSRVQPSTAITQKMQKLESTVKVGKLDCGAVKQESRLDTMFTNALHERAMNELQDYIRCLRTLRCWETLFIHDQDVRHENAAQEACGRQISLLGTIRNWKTVKTFGTRRII